MKNPFEHISPRTIRAVYLLFAASVLFVTGVNFTDVMIRRVISNDQCAWEPALGRDSLFVITKIVPGGVTDRAGIEDGDILLRIDGKTYSGAREAMSHINRHSAGSKAVYTIERDERRFDVEVEILKVFNIDFLAQFCLGLGFLLVGLFVVMARPQGRVQRKFGRYGILAMLFFGTTTIYPAEGGWQSAVVFFGMLVGRIFAPPQFVSFFFHFPVRKNIAGKKSVVVLLYILSVATTAILPLVFEKVFPQWTIIIAIVFQWTMFISGLGFFTHSYFREVEIDRRSQLRPILVSTIIGVAAFIYTTIIATTYPLAIFIQPELLIPSVLLAFMPPAFGYAIIRYRLMDVVLIVKRSLIYAAVTATIAAFYFLFVFGVGNVIGVIFDAQDNTLLTLIAFVLIAFLFDPIKQRVQSAIDKVFYQERTNYQKALLEFSRELPMNIDLERILELMVHRISTTMHVERVAVALCSDASGCSVATKNIPTNCCEFDNSHYGLISLLRRQRVPQSFALVEDEFNSLRISNEDKERIRISGIVLSIPMFLKEELIGTINVGPKMSGKVYSQDDIDLLSTVASQAAIAIENARLHLAEIEKQKIEEEIAIAHRIQEGLLPKSMPALKGLDITGISLPARSVGGDYFDFIPLPNDRLFVVVADVSGKGMPAALYMSKVQGMIQLAAQMYQSPHEILSHVNRLIYDGIERNSFITMILALFDIPGKEIRLCRAGHVLPLIGNGSGMQFIESKGIGLGLEKGPLFDSKLEEIRLPLTEGSKFVFYSDGLTEMMNAAREEYGEKRLIDVVSQRDNLGAHELQSTILRSVASFRNGIEPHDDLTLVVMKYA